MEHGFARSECHWHVRNARARPSTGSYLVESRRRRGHAAADHVAASPLWRIRSRDRAAVLWTDHFAPLHSSREASALRIARAAASSRDGLNRRCSRSKYPLFGTTAGNHIRLGREAGRTHLMKVTGQREYVNVLGVHVEPLAMEPAVARV